MPNKHKLSPIQHASLNDHHRVPVVNISGKYEVYVGDNFIRLYDADDLPEIIKSRLTMIRAATEEPPRHLSVETIGEIYSGNPNSPLFDIGWWVTKELFIVVIPTKELTYLRGEANNMSMAFIGARRTKIFYFASPKPSEVLIMNDRPTFRTLDELYTYHLWGTIADDTGGEGKS